MHMNMGHHSHSAKGMLLFVYMHSSAMTPSQTDCASAEALLQNRQNDRTVELLCVMKELGT